MEHAAFQSIFGEIMTLLIALEFNHALRYVVTKHQSIIQAKVVVLRALLAVARKFIILDIRDATTGYSLGLAAITWHSARLIGSCASVAIRRTDSQRCWSWRRVRERRSSNR